MARVSAGASRGSLAADPEEPATMVRRAGASHGQEDDRARVRERHAGRCSAEEGKLQAGQESDEASRAADPRADEEVLADFDRGIQAHVAQSRARLRACPNQVRELDDRRLHPRDGREHVQEPDRVRPSEKCSTKRAVPVCAQKAPCEFASRDRRISRGLETRLGEKEGAK